MSDVDAKLASLGVTLPEAPAPAANYVPYVISNGQVFVAGQVPRREGAFVTGTLGKDTSLEEGQEAARLCAIAILAQLKAACGGDWSRLVRVVKLGAFVACTPEFTDQPKVANGASDFLVEVLGDRGRHARFAVGAPSLPLGVAVEIDGVFEVR